MLLLFLLFVFRLVDVVLASQWLPMMGLGMSELVKERPANPIEYLASYLLRHDPQRVGNTTTPSIPTSMQQGGIQQQAAPMHR